MSVCNVNNFWKASRFLFGYLFKWWKNVVWLLFTNLGYFWIPWVGNTESFSAWVIGPFPVCHKAGSGGHILTLFTQTPFIAWCLSSHPMKGSYVKCQKGFQSGKISEFFCHSDFASILGNFRSHKCPFRQLYKKGI